MPGIADAVSRALSDPAAARRRSRAARARLREDFDWARIAASTAEVYAAARTHAPRELARPKIPTGNVLGRT